MRIGISSKISHGGEGPREGAKGVIEELSASVPAPAGSSSEAVTT
jgi:hypothetical protein